MEFYFVIHLDNLLVLLVSIPNGMEFYLELSDFEGSGSSFNSQRDGILQHEFCHFSR